MENPAFFLISGDSLKLQEAGVWDATLGFVASKECPETSWQSGIVSNERR
jgi:hypothetical protein